MTRTLDLLQQFCNVIQAQARSKLPEISGHDFEGNAPSRGSADGKAASERFVHNLPIWPSRPARLGPELGRHVLVQRERRTHILMLSR